MREEKKCVTCARKVSEGPFKPTQYSILVSLNEDNRSQASFTKFIKFLGTQILLLWNLQLVESHFG